MKMKATAILLLILTLVLTGCGKEAEEIQVDETISTNPNEVTVESCTQEVSEEDTNKKDWGIALLVKNVTKKGLTLICTQSGGESTGELNTGEEYKLYVLKNNNWEEVPYIIEEFGWNSIAYIVPMEDSVEWEINWEWLYGELPDGTYKMVKEFMDFRGAGDYDKENYFVEFEIEE